LGRQPAGYLKANTAGFAKIVGLDCLLGWIIAASDGGGECGKMAAQKFSCSLSAGRGHLKKNK